MKFFSVSEQLMTGVLNYLGKRPFIEVVGLINELSQCKIISSSPVPATPPPTREKEGKE